MEDINKRSVVDYSAKNIFGKMVRSQEPFDDEESARKFVVEIVKKEEATNGRDAYFHSWCPIKETQK